MALPVRLLYPIKIGEDAALSSKGRDRLGTKKRRGC